MNAADLSSAQWRKSSRSGHQGGECVELAALPGLIAVRDSKHPTGPVLGLTHPAFQTLVAEIHAGRHDL